jgi:hypothetical protein
MPITIRKAEIPEDRQRVFRFRYEIYVEEMKRPQTYADHAARIIEEPLDATGRIYFAEDDQGSVIGTVRSNYGCDTDFGDYEGFYQLRCAGGNFPDRVSITTKLMVGREHRQGTLGARLSMATYRDGITSGILFDFIDCNPHLEDTFHRFGYRRFTGRIQHPEYGDVLPLVLLLTDLEHLEQVGSPFVRPCREHLSHIEANRLLHQVIHKHQTEQQNNAA